MRHLWTSRAKHMRYRWLRDSKSGFFQGCGADGGQYGTASTNTTTHSRREGKQKTDAEYVEELWRLLDGRRPDVVVVDPSAASFIESFAGARVLRVQKADNDVLWAPCDAGMLKEKNSFFA